MDAIDLNAVALNRLQSSVRNQVGLTGFVSGIAAQSQELDNALLATSARLRGLMVADSNGPVWLDQVAKLVGTSKGSDDSDARAIQFIGNQIRINIGWGGINDILALADVLYGTNNTWLSDGGDIATVSPSGMATHGVDTYIKLESKTPLVPVLFNDYQRIRVQLGQGKPAGVLLMMGALIGSPGTTAFRYDTVGAGYDGPAVYYTFL